MARFIAGIIFLIAVGGFVRHQYSTVVKQINSKSTTPVFQTPSRQESRTKCVMCNGTGRSTGFNFTAGKSSATQACRSCNGIGWIDNPTFGR